MDSSDTPLLIETWTDEVNKLYLSQGKLLELAMKVTTSQVYSDMNNS